MDVLQPLYPPNGNTYEHTIHSTLEFFLSSSDAIEVIYTLAMLKLIKISNDIQQKAFSKHILKSIGFDGTHNQLSVNGYQQYKTSS